MIKVCPESELLSVYFDGEMPSPWKEKMEAHVAGCPDCARKLEAYKRLALTSDDAAFAGELAAAQERVWQKLEQHTGVRRSMSEWNSRPAWRATSAWRRSISIPIPAAAAAVLLIAFAFVFTFRMAGTTEKNGVIFASETEFDMPGFIPISDMGNMDMMQYLDLDNRDNGDIIILRLPESRSFVNYGEPAIINASDYSRQLGRQVSTRQMSGRRQ